MNIDRAAAAESYIRGQVEARELRLATTLGDLYSLWIIYPFDLYSGRDTWKAHRQDEVREAWPELAAKLDELVRAAQT